MLKRRGLRVTGEVETEGKLRGRRGGEGTVRENKEEWSGGSEEIERGIVGEEKFKLKRR